MKQRTLYKHLDCFASVQSCDKVAEVVHSIDVESDVTKFVSYKGNGPRQSEQLLPDYYVC